MDYSGLHCNPSMLLMHSKHYAKLFHDVINFLSPNKETTEQVSRLSPVENATYYEVSVWKMSTANTSLVLDRRSSMGFGSGLALAQGAWLVRAGVGDLRDGDEAGAMACNRYGCSRALLLRPTEILLQAASPPWYHGKYFEVIH